MLDRVYIYNDKIFFVVYDYKSWSKNPNGYYEGCSNNKYKERLLHRYIWTEYNGHIPDGFVVHHIDRDITNNNISNLKCMSKNEHSILHMRGYIQTETHKANRSKALTGYKRSKGNKANIARGMGCSIRCLETGIIYPSMIEASRLTGITNISRAVETGVSAKDTHWERI